nr:MAG TPA: hypothetical protein [Caudoviricetes sp.]
MSRGFRKFFDFSKKFFIAANIKTNIKNDIDKRVFAVL